MERHLLLPQFLMFASVILLLSGAARAGHVYSYDGNTYNSIPIDSTPPAGTFTGSMKVTASFELSQALGPLLPPTDISASPDLVSLTVNDGRTNYDLSDLDELTVSTGPAGEILAWSLVVDQRPIVTQYVVGSQWGRVEGNNSLGGLETARWTECLELTENGFFCQTENSDVAQSQQQPGTWTVEFVAAPVPSMAPTAVYVLLPSLLAGAGVMGMRRRLRRGE